MIPAIALALALSHVSSGLAQDPAVQRPASMSVTEASDAAPELARLDQVLSLAQEAKQEGRLDPQRYDEFLKQFRAFLDKALAATPPSPTASALYARILARLGEPQQAMAALGTALERNPEDPNLRVALGHVRFEEGDYPAAHAEALAALRQDPTNKQALALKLFTQGRAKGLTAGTAAPLPASGLEEASLLQDPRVIEAGRRALARQSAISYTDEAMRRLQIKDPSEALRQLAMAEALDPGYPDVAMQQGFAYRELRQYAEAVERFGRAEALWRARKTPKTDELAAMARSMREEQSAALAQARKPSESTPKPPEPRMPLWPVGAALIAVGLGAAVIIDKRRQEAQARELIAVAGPAGIVLAGAVLVAASLFPPANIISGTGNAAVLAETWAAARAATGAYATKELLSGYTSFSKAQSAGESTGSETPANAGRPKATESSYKASDLPHIFRDAPGHVADTPHNRRLFLDVASDKSNFIGTNRYGTECYARLTSDGRQVWVYVRNGLMRNAGINRAPLSPERILGL